MEGTPSIFTFNSSFSFAALLTFLIELNHFAYEYRYRFSVFQSVLETLPAGEGLPSQDAHSASRLKLPYLQLQAASLMLLPPL